MPNPSTAQLVARADSQSTATSNPSSSAGPTTPLAQWTAQTDRSCTTLLTTLSQSSSSLVSASGIAPCYNIPIFYANNGTFVADLRLYQIRDPSGDWAGLSAGGLEVGVQFPDAVVSAAQLEMGPLGRLQKRDGEGAMLEKRGVVVPVLLHTFDFDGKIDAGEDTDIATYKQLFLPTVTVSGRSTSNSPLASTLSLLSTSYLNGHFASPSAANVSTLNPPARPYAVNPLLQTPFVVPGRALGVFPISLVFVGAWTLFLLLVVGLGSVARWRERTGHRSTLRRNHQVELRTLHLVNRLGQ